MAITAFAEDKSTEQTARSYVDAFLKGNMQLLLEHASPELRALMKDAASMNAMRAGSVGNGAITADEKLGADYTRLVKSTKGQMFSISASVTSDGTLAGFLIQPTGEAPSNFLDYKTKADARLPFAGTWTVFWGGRSVKDNYHASYSDQRFADDIVMMKNGQTHSGIGVKNEDYYCFGQAIIAPAAGLVAAVVDGIDDNKPGKMNPAEAAGNHVVLDLGNDEYLFLCHLQKGSLKVKPGDHVTQGQAIGLCGNSGNTSEPHLHIHLQTKPNFGEGEGLPLQFEHYVASGKAVDRGEPTKGQLIHDASDK
jgi:murein DD-endopeptidase MepM/ murein hydrolase activator NlpD